MRKELEKEMYKWVLDQKKKCEKSKKKKKTDIMEEIYLEKPETDNEEFEPSKAKEKQEINRTKKLEKEKTSDEKSAEVSISEVEKSNLERVFNLFVTKEINDENENDTKNEEVDLTEYDAGKEAQNEDDKFSYQDDKELTFGSENVKSVLNKLDVKVNNSIIDMMIWVNLL